MAWLVLGRPSSSLLSLRHCGSGRPSDTTSASLPSAAATPRIGCRDQILDTVPLTSSQVGWVDWVFHTSTVPAASTNRPPLQLVSYKEQATRTGGMLGVIHR